MLSDKKKLPLKHLTSCSNAKDYKNSKNIVFTLRKLKKLDSIKKMIAYKKDHYLKSSLIHCQYPKTLRIYTYVLFLLFLNLTVLNIF